MPAPVIYRSTDTNAPVLSGTAGALISLLDAILVNGYGSKASAGWAKSFSGTNQAVYRQPAGCRFYLQVDDSGPGTGAAREARCFGFEAMTAYNTGSGQFPTAAQIAAGAVIRKSSLLDATARAWIAFADDRTFYLFTLTGDSAGNYHGFSFGDFYSLVPGEAYKCLIASGSNEAAGSAITSLFGQMASGLPTSATGHWLPRNYSGIGGSTNFVKIGDISLTAGAGVTTAMSGVIGFPNASDGGLYVAPLRIIDGSSPGTSILGTPYLRGRMRGLFQVCHPFAPFADGDIFPGSGDYAGRTFQIIKYLHSSSASQAFGAIETTAWETSA